MPTDEVTLWVPGVPVPKGSKKQINHKISGKPVMIDVGGKRLTAWTKAVRETARIAAREAGFMPAAAGQPVEVRIAFLLDGRYAGRGDWATGKPDGDKIERATWDALVQAKVIADDSLIVSWRGTKRIAAPGATGAAISIKVLQRRV